MFDIKNIYEPKTLREALELYSQNPEAKLIAGGTDVLIKFHNDVWEEETLISLLELRELKSITLDKHGEIVIGALSSFHDVMESKIILSRVPMFAQAASTMGGPQIRNMATIGGNLANGAVSADSAPMLLALDARVRLEKKDSERYMPLEDFYVGPGKVKLEPGEILTEIRIPESSQNVFKGYYYKYAVRNAMDIANISLATAFITNEDGIIEDMRIALGVAAPTPIRCRTAEEFAVGKELNSENLERIGEIAVNCSKSRDSWRASKAYREHLIPVMLKESCEKAVKA